MPPKNVVAKYMKLGGTVVSVSGSTRNRSDSQPVSRRTKRIPPRLSILATSGIGESPIAVDSPSKTIDRPRRVSLNEYLTTTESAKARDLALGGREKRKLEEEKKKKQKQKELEEMEEEDRKAIENLSLSPVSPVESPKTPTALKKAKKSAEWARLDRHESADGKEMRKKLLEMRIRTRQRAVESTLAETEDILRRENH